MKQTEITAEPGDQGERLDRFLAAHLPDLSRRQIRSLLGQGGCFVNGHRVRIASRPIRAGDRVLLHLQVATTHLPPLHTLYEDGDLLVVDKPAGIHVNVTQTNPGTSLVEAVQHHLATKPGERPYVGLIHRLDRGTSGCILFTKNPAANRSLAEQFRDRRVQKVYEALALGTVPAEGMVLEGAIGRDPGDPRHFIVGGRDARPARTEVALVDRSGPVSRLRLLPRTGRTHQIRVHLATAGYPILGDPAYGGPLSLEVAGHHCAIPRVMLHARSLAFHHPRTQQRLEVEAEPAADLEAIWQQLQEATP